MATKKKKRSLSPAESPKSTNNWKKIGLWSVIPALIYFVFFSFYSWPWIVHFNTRFFTDQGDGFQNVWNVWWVNYSATHLHQLPWHTTYLHFPYGTSLLGQTMNPFNGFVAIVLLKFLSLAQAFNTMIIFSFVTAGVTSFWLCYHFSRKYIPSLIGGFIFTFSSYHFAHAIGHMQLVSLEWMPLFILLWWKLLTKPRYRTALGAIIALFLVLMCDYYYFLYCLGAAGLILLYLWRSKQLAPIKDRATYRPFILFVAIGLVIIAPLPLDLIRENSNDPLLGSHPERQFSADLGNIFLDGEFWRFGALTHGYWRHVQAYWAESSIYLSFSVLVTLAIALWKRGKLHRDVTFWLTLAIIFGIFSLGPRLMVHGYSINHAPMPYALLEKIIPPLKLSGVPIRMIVMTILASAIIASIVLSKLNLHKRKGQILLGVFFLVLFVELWPSGLPTNVVMHPAYVEALAKLPDAKAGVLDNGAATPSWQLYDQTIYQKPMILGYISRVPTSVNTKDTVLINTIGAGKYSELCSLYGVRYYTTPVTRPLRGWPVVYRDKQTLIYDLKDSPKC